MSCAARPQSLRTSDGSTNQLPRVHRVKEETDCANYHAWFLPEDKIIGSPKMALDNGR
jgi:hypothetical protein